ncbi:MAG TPA: tetratricopeptide repeat protein [Candidatus Methylacidiphilales bacterium]|nr:tetratricopeptide repeat protein [Candidatus Methylacidiphilales bacterium]
MKAHLWFLLPVLVVLPLVSSADPTDLASLQARVAKGDAEAELELGRDYHLGTGVTQDFAKAAELYRKAAAQGNAKAMFNLGYLSAHAQGMAKDIPTAAQWYRKAADKGLPAGQLALGMLYYFGDNGIPQDFPSAVKWLTLAAQHEDAPAQEGPAANALASIYETGMTGVPENGEKSLSWYTKGAELGYPLAQGNLGRVYFDATIVKQDRVRAYVWLTLAADQGDMNAEHELADYNGGNAFSDQEKAEGDREVQAYAMKRRLHRQARIALDPLPPVPAAASTSAGTNAAPAAALPPVTAKTSATAAAPTAGGAHTN